MKRLVKVETPKYCSEVIIYNCKKFKVVCENGNAFSRLYIYTFTNNGDLALIANGNDVPNYVRVDYMEDDEKLKELGVKNLIAAEEYIKAIY